MKKMKEKEGRGEREREMTSFLYSGGGDSCLYQTEEERERIIMRERAPGSERDATIQQQGTPPGRELYGNTGRIEKSVSPSRRKQEKERMDRQ